MLHLENYSFVRFEVMLGVVLRHTNPDSSVSFSYFDPSGNTSLFRNRLFVLTSARSIQDFKDRLNNLPSLTDVVASNFGANSKDCIESIVTLLIRYFY